MNTRIFITALFLVSFFTADAQIKNVQMEKCGLTRSVFSRLYTVNVEDVICLAQNSDSDITIFYTFAYWCVPCRKRLPEIIRFAEKHNVDFYVLLTSQEGNRRDVGRALQKFHTEYDNQLNVVIISDSLFSKRAVERLERRARRGFVLVETGRLERDKYINFLAQITPPEMGNIIPGMGIFIVLNRKGEVLLVTNDYQDAQNLTGLRSGEADVKIFERVRQVIQNSRN